LVAISQEPISHNIEHRLFSSSSLYCTYLYKNSIKLDHRWATK